MVRCITDAIAAQQDCLHAAAFFTSATPARISLALLIAPSPAVLDGLLVMKRTSSVDGLYIWRQVLRAADLYDGLARFQQLDG
jgi:hypothetical protein